MKSRDYKKLLGLLPKGGVQQLAQQFNKTTRQIYYDLKNDVIEVVETASAMAQEEKQARAKRQQKSNKLVESL